MQANQEPAGQLLPCADKLAFDTEKQARATATASTWRYGAKFKVYLCRHCNLFHIASQTAK